VFWYLLGVSCTRFNQGVIDVSAMYLLLLFFLIASVVLFVRAIQISKQRLNPVSIGAVIFVASIPEVAIAATFETSLKWFVFGLIALVWITTLTWGIWYSRQSPTP
jgi:hypothetical protein